MGKVKESEFRSPLPPLMTRTRKRSPPLTKAFAMSTRAEPYPRKKSESSCPSGLPPPRLGKIAERPRRNSCAHRRGRRWHAASQFGASLLDHVDLLSPFPRIGSVTQKRPQVRKLLHSPLLVYYRVHENKRLIEILHVRHGSGSKPAVRSWMHGPVLTKAPSASLPFKFRGHVPRGEGQKKSAFPSPGVEDRPWRKSDSRTPRAIGPQKSGLVKRVPSDDDNHENSSGVRWRLFPIITKSYAD